MVAQTDAAFFECHQRVLESRERAAELLHLVAGNLPTVARQEHALAESLVEELRLHLLLGLHVVGLFLRPHAEQRWLGDIDMAGRHELIHLAVEKCQQQGADVGAVDVGVGHDHNLVIPTLAEVGLDTDAGTNRRDHAANLLVGEHLVVTAFIGIDDLAAEREDRLILTPPATLSRTAGRITLYQIDFTLRDIAAGAVAEFARQATP